MSQILRVLHPGSETGLGAIVAVQKSLGEGHAMVAYHVVDTGAGNYDILVHNPNVPFDVGQTVMDPAQASTGMDEDTDPAYRAAQAGRGRCRGRR